MDKNLRYRLLNKLAKKGLENPLRGKLPRKDVEKQLTQAKDTYNKAANKLREVNVAINALQAEKKALEQQEAAAKGTINYCHELLHKFDLSGAQQVKIGPNIEDVAFNIDGKWVGYDLETGIAPYKKVVKEDSIALEEKEDEDFNNLNEGIEII